MTAPRKFGDAGLDPDLRPALEEHLGPAAQDDAALVERVGARVMRAIRGEPGVQHLTIRAGDDDWRTIAPGVERKLLWATASSLSCMMRMAPGAVLPAHLHTMDEECVVLQGSVRIGALELQVGDFHLGRQGSTHEATTSETGAVVYLRGALRVVPV